MPWASVERNVSLPLVLSHNDPPQVSGRVARALRLVGLEEFRALYPRQLSEFVAGTRGTASGSPISSLWQAQRTRKA